jgi:transposase
LRGVAREGIARLEVALPSSLSIRVTRGAVVAKVVIGVDPHKRMNAVCVLDGRGKVLAQKQFPNSAAGFRELKVFWRQWRPRTWAIEGCNGVGKHLAQRLVAEGERVLDVSTRRAALVRVYAGGNGRKNDDTDAQSIALVGLNSTDLPEVRPDDVAVTLRLLSNRRTELVRLRTQAVCRVHRDLVVLVPGGAPRSLTAAKAKVILSRIRPRDELGRLRRQLIADQIVDLVAIDRRLDEVNRQVKAAVATPTRLTRIYGVGPVTTARILGEVGDVARFRSRHHFASYNGTGPTDSGSGGPPTPRVNTKGNRKLNHAIHIAAVSQIRSSRTEGRRYYLRKLAEGKSDKEALRALKRKISDAIYRQLLADAEQAAGGPGGHVGTTPKTSVTDPTPTAGSSVKPQPGPRSKATPRPPSRRKTTRVRVCS